MAGDSAAFEKLRSRLSLDDEGRLTLNGLPMILLPRHFFRYILREVHLAAGPQVFRKIFRQAGHDGALTFCRRFRETFQCSPREAVEGYFAEMSLRGWGRFQLVRLNPAAGELEVLLENSALAEEEDLPAGNIIWVGAATGAMTFLRENSADAPTGMLDARSEDVPAQPGRPAAFRIIVSPSRERKIS